MPKKNRKKIKNSTCYIARGEYLKMSESKGETCVKVWNDDEREEMLMVVE